MADGYPHTPDIDAIDGTRLDAAAELVPSLPLLRRIALRTLKGRAAL